MKNLKLWLAALTAIGLSTLSAFAQGTGGRQQPDTVARMTQKLNLSRAQQTKIRAIIQDTIAKIERVHNNPNALQNITKRDAEERELYLDETAKMIAVLTPAQRRTWSGLPGTRLQRELDQLGLDASQKHKIAAIIKEMYAKMEATPEDQRVTRVRAIRDAYHGRIEAVLTPAQKQRFEAAR